MGIQTSKLVSFGDFFNFFSTVFRACFQFPAERCPFNTESVTNSASARDGMSAFANVAITVGRICLENAHALDSQSEATDRAASIGRRGMKSRYSHGGTLSCHFRLHLICLPKEFSYACQFRTRYLSRPSPGLLFNMSLSCSRLALPVAAFVDT